MTNKISRKVNLILSSNFDCHFQTLFSQKQLVVKLTNVFLSLFNLPNSLVEETSEKKGEGPGAS